MTHHTDAILQRAGISPALLDSPLSRVTRDELWSLCSHPLKLGSLVADKKFNRLNSSIKTPNAQQQHALELIRQMRV